MTKEQLLEAVASAAKKVEGVTDSTYYSDAGKVVIVFRVEGEETSRFTFFKLLSDLFDAHALIFMLDALEGKRPKLSPTAYETHATSGRYFCSISTPDGLFTFCGPSRAWATALAFVAVFGEKGEGA